MYPYRLKKPEEIAEVNDTPPVDHEYSLNICFCAPGGRRHGKENKGKGKIYEKKGEGQRKGGGFSLRKEKKGKRKVYDKRKEKDKEKEVGFLSD